MMNTSILESPRPIERIGFIGLGIMGIPMVRNLLKAGFEVAVYSRTKEKVLSLIQEGASSAETVAELASVSQVVITMLPDSSDVESVTTRHLGIFAGASPGLIVIDMSTISPLVTRRLSSLALEKRFSWLDAPVSGGESGAKAGTLSIMVGGELETFNRARPVLKAMGDRILYMGESGQGQNAKLCNQILVSINLLAASEALVFGAKAGLNLELLMSSLTAGAGNSWALENLGPRMLKRDFEPGFMLRLLQKDLRLLSEAAMDLRVPLLGATLVQQLLTSLEAEGRGGEGTQAFVKTLESLAKVQVSGGSVNDSPLNE